MSNNKQSSVEKEFVPYAESLELKELGFDEPCFTIYYEDTGRIRTGLSIHIHNAWTYSGTKRLETTLAPTYSQAFRFFREKYNCHHSITRLPQKALDVDIKNNKLLKKYAWFISKDDLNPTIPNNGSGKCDTYEEAELACLIALIKIVKEKQK